MFEFVPEPVDLKTVRISPVMQEHIDKAVGPLISEIHRIEEERPKGLGVIVHPVRALRSVIKIHRLEDRTRQVTVDTIQYAGARSMASFFSAKNTDGAGW